MGLAAGAFLKGFQTFLYAIEFCCAAIILGFYSYFLAVQSDRNINIPTSNKAVEGISGVAVVYTIFAVILTCCLGGKKFFAFLAVLLDVLFCAAFVALAVLTRHGAASCHGNVKTPLGNGPADSRNGFGGNGFGEGSGENVTYSVSLKTACHYNTACFAVSIIGAILFLISALVQVWIARNHQKEKRYGPGPNNGYTRGSGRGGLFSRFRRRRGARDPEAAAIKEQNMRASTETGTTAPVAPHGGYHTNPYNSTNTATNY